MTSYVLFAVHVATCTCILNSLIWLNCKRFKMPFVDLSLDLIKLVLLLPIFKNYTGSQFHTHLIKDNLITFKTCSCIVSLLRWAHYWISTRHVPRLSVLTSSAQEDVVPILCYRNASIQFYKTRFRQNNFLWPS